MYSVNGTLLYWCMLTVFKIGMYLCSWNPTTNIHWAFRLPTFTKISCNYVIILRNGVYFYQENNSDRREAKVGDQQTPYGITSEKKDVRKADLTGLLCVVIVTKKYQRGKVDNLKSHIAFSCGIVPRTAKESVLSTLDNEDNSSDKKNRNCTIKHKLANSSLVLSHLAQRQSCLLTVNLWNFWLAATFLFLWCKIHSSCPSCKPSDLDTYHHPGLT